MNSFIGLRLIIKSFELIWKIAGIYILSYIETEHKFGTIKMLIFQKMEHIISQYSTEEVEHFNQAVIQILNALREGYEQKDDTK